MNTTEQENLEILFTDLYNRYARSMYSIAWSILHDRAQSEDVVQDAFLQLMRYLPQIKAAGSYKTKGLISEITKNIAINRYRKNRQESLHVKSGDAYEECAEIPAPFANVKSAEDRQFIRQILDKLDTETREIIEFRCFYELNYREIAAILEITEQAAAKRFERAKKTIQNMIGDDYYV